MNCSCSSPKDPSECDVCFEPVCKKCALKPAPDAFMYQPEVPEGLKKDRYCSRCFDSEVAPSLARYDEILERAKNVIFLTNAFKGHLPILKRAKTDVEIEGIMDRDELILRLGFLAAEAGYNSLIRSEVVSKKIRNEAYQKSEWSGHGTPALLDEKKFKIQEEREETYRRGK